MKPGYGGGGLREFKPKFRFEKQTHGGPCGPRTLAYEHVLKVRHKLRAGASVVEIATEFGVSDTCVRKFMRRYRISAPNAKGARI